jgi:predicted MFS family arabinose efflux permease
VLPSAIALPCLVVSTLSSTALCAYVTRYTTIVWLFTACLGLALGPLLPGAYLWADVFLSPAPKALALALASAHLGSAVSVWLGGMLIEHLGGSITIFYLTAVCSVLHLATYLPLIRSLNERRYLRVTKRKGHELVLIGSSHTYV